MSKFKMDYDAAVLKQKIERGATPFLAMAEICGVAYLIGTPGVDSIIATAVGLALDGGVITCPRCGATSQEEAPDKCIGDSARCPLVGGSL